MKSKFIAPSKRGNMPHEKEILNKSSMAGGQVISEDVVLVSPPHPFFIHEPRTECREVGIHDLIARADEFVTMSSEGMANVAKGIHKAMSPTEVEWVEQMVAIHNLKLHKRPPFGKVPRRPLDPSSTGSTTSDTGSSSQALDPAPSPCVPHVNVSFYWWGFRIYMDHCICKLVTSFGTPIAGAGTVIAGILAAAGVGGPWIALAAGLILLMAAWIAWADGYCTPNSGANYNQSWTVQGWITTVC